MLSEIALHTIIDPKYCGSVFFWIDFVCKLSYFLDIESVKDMVFINSTKDIAKTAKITRLGAKATKIIRIIRITRLLHV